MEDQQQAFIKTHKGLMYCIVPIYIDRTLDPSPGIQGRNLFCDLLLDLADVVFDFAAMCMSYLDPEYEPMFFFKITEELIAPNAQGEYVAPVDTETKEA